MTTPKKCSFPDCTRDLTAQNLCLMHYKRLKRQGVIKKIEHPKVCAVDNCNNKCLALGYCRMHYKRYKAHGDPMTRFVTDYGGSESHPLYSTWLNMKQRCYNPKCSEYLSYGGRGIKVSERWNSEGGFKRFAEDMGSKPTSKHSIDRINNDGNYEPNNCRWATKHEQMRNTQRVTDNPGVRKEVGGYSAYIKINKINMRLGLYKTKAEAIARRKQAEIEVDA